MYTSVFLFWWFKKVAGQQDRLVKWVAGPMQKLSASGRRTGGNFQHCLLSAWKLEKTLTSFVSLNDIQYQIITCRNWFWGLDAILINNDFSNSSNTMTVDSYRWSQKCSHLPCNFCGLGASCVLTHLPLDNMAAISQMICSDAFPWMESYVFWLKFHWSLFVTVHLIIIQHWFR